MAKHSEQIVARDADYDNSAAVPDAERFIPLWEDEARVFRDSMGDRARLGIPYGATAREKLDLFLPDGAPDGLMVFVHGGYWRSRHRHDWSHFAEGALGRGYAVAIPSYSLAPEARISRITLQIAQAVRVAAAEVAGGPIRLAGHSAGGHLVARMLCADPMLPASVAKRLAHVLPISPVSDLRPLVGLSMNGDLKLTAEEAAMESPILCEVVHRAPVTVWVGGAELPAFQNQAQWLSEAWDARIVVDEGRHHFDVIDGLRAPDSPMLKALFDA
ncbi:Alpha/beta hydrolase family protein [Palleronia marisminoris]|uniref:Alpha/beta hydrolase family protein n=1 Tax=Palleronia marisminoris TaxID=315423 RepID=A0A1Y5SFV4_9RHOB|nr:alpha/beta hydrolase [Palleronia marisminoris]SFG80215.1 Alpha/beta hydrolase family protein [Palleronia marisminoris]SLN39468.1 Alpha/beta hydrolase family protein [Palleronia marisminoris]